MTIYAQPEKIIEVQLREGETPRVVLSGDIDFRRAHEIKDAIAQLVDQGHKRIDIRLADVVFIDSSGISALLDSIRIAREKGARLVLVSPTRQLLHLLEISGFKPLFEFEELPPAPAPPAPGPVLPPVSWQMSEFSVPCNPELVADIRHRVAQIAESMSFSEDEIEDIKLAVGEAATNAFRYGCLKGEADKIDVRCLGDTIGLTIEITDSGPGFDPSQIPTPELGSLAPGGRGIFFMRLTMDTVEFFCLDDGTLVRMVKYAKCA